MDVKTRNAIKDILENVSGKETEVDVEDMETVTIFILLMIIWSHLKTQQTFVNINV